MVETAQGRAARLRRLRSKRPGYSSAKNRDWNARNPEKRRAHKAVEYAVKTGRLIRRGCEVCGAERAQAHHENYARPLEISWLCQQHHKEHHRLGVKHARS